MTTSMQARASTSAGAGAPPSPMSARTSVPFSTQTANLMENTVNRVRAFVPTFSTSLSKREPSVKRPGAKGGSDLRLQLERNALRMCSNNLAILGVMMLACAWWDAIWNVRQECSATYSWGELALIFVLDILFLACTMPFLKRIREQPGEKQNMQKYLRLLMLWYLRVTLQAFPPFGKTCAKRKEVFQDFQVCAANTTNGIAFKSGVLNAMRNMNCTPMGHSQVQLLMTWILLSPMFMPTTKLMWYNILYVLTIQFPATVLYRRILDEFVYFKRDMSTTIGLLVFVSVIAAGRKYYMVRNEESMARSDREAKEVTQKLYDILKFMVPQHVIERLLCGEVVADPLERVSILFVIIVDFDEHVKKLQPEELVEFLNDNFTAWDDICYNHWVTKIETVGEEYVCAVGVSPKDQRENERHGHRRPLSRLMQASLRILAMHNENVKLKMGMHTGPIVAGVLGEAKLPRFRLFGDTINTSARMMQKGQPGKLQFGEETYKDVAKLCREDLPAKVQEKNGIAPGRLVQDNGHVEMKGKGMVRTFLVEPREMVRAPRTSADASIEGEFRRSLLGAAAFEEEPFTSTRSRSKQREPRDQPRRPQQDGELPKGWHQALPLGGQTSTSSSSSARTPLQSAFNIEEAVVDTDLAGAGGDDGDDDDADPRSGLEATLAAVDAAKKGENYNMWIQLTSFGLRSSFFTDDHQEMEFRKWFHQEIVCHKLESRLHKQAVMLVALSGLEMIYFELLKVLGRGSENDEGDELTHWLEESLHKTAHFDTDGLPPGVMRLPIFISCRFLAYFIIISWQGIARMGESYAQRLIPQRALMLSYCVMTFLFFISYDAITSVNNSNITEEATDRELSDMMINHTRDSSINSLIYFPIYVLIISQIKCRFEFSILFVFMAVALMYLVKWKDWFNLFFSMSGRAYFLGVSCFYSALAWKDEFIHRRRFKAKTHIKESKESIDRMLSKLMPEEVLEEIKAKEARGDPKPPSHFYRHATIAQSDLVGFTALASTRSPDVVVSLISELFGMFDEKADLYSIYKVETVGDAYIAGQADPPLTQENKPANVARFGLAMIEATKEWGEMHGLDVSCRVGLHTGQCYGGIVGNDMRRYHLFGDLMTALEVLESTAPKGCVQVSAAWKKAFDKSATVEDKLELNIIEREGDKLTTSKGEEHSYDEVGGRTFVIHPDPK